jgi:hypothetical protein
MTKKQHSAIRLARSLTGSVYRIHSGPEGWGYNVWDERAKLWRSSPGMTYQQAQQACAAYVAITAYIALAGEADDHTHLYEAETQGMATERLATLLRLYPIESTTP